MSSNCRTTHERWIWRELQGSCPDVIGVLSYHLPGGTKADHGIGSRILAEIRTDHSLNTSLEGYCYASLLVFWTWRAKTDRRNLNTKYSEKQFDLSSEFCFTTGVLFTFSYYSVPNTLAARSEAWNVFPRSDTRVVGSNTTRGMDVCSSSVFVLSYVDSGPCS
jgi:hypothetical protein